MALTLDDLITAMEALWPPQGRESWDKPGLVAGNPAAAVERVLFSVDLSAGVVEEARSVGADLIVNHHPFLLRGVHSVAEDTAKGAVLSTAIRSNIAIYSAHTNADVVSSGTSAVLAAAIGLEGDSLAPLVPAEDARLGLGRVGNLATPVTLERLAEQVSAALPATGTGVRVAGPGDAQVSRVALCAGAGDSLLDIVLSSDADVYITSDLRHHPAQEAREQALLRGGKPFLIDISHWAAESLWLQTAAAELVARFPALSTRISSVSTDPWDFAIGQLGRRR